MKRCDADFIPSGRLRMTGCGGCRTDRKRSAYHLEAHICDVIRARFAVRKVTASHSKGQAVVLSESGLDEAALRQAIAETGYEVTAVSARPAEEKKGLCGFLKR